MASLVNRRMASSTGSASAGGERPCMGTPYRAVFRGARPRRALRRETGRRKPVRGNLPGLRGLGGSQQLT